MQQSCLYCGIKLDGNEKFCPSCGAPVPAQASQASSGQQQVAGTAQPLPKIPGREFGVILSDLGTCNVATATALFERLLGYDEIWALDLIAHRPSEVAVNLSAHQARAIARAMTGYGMEAVVYRGDSYVDMEDEDDDDDSGTSLLQKALQLLGSLTGNQRVEQASTWKRPDYSSHAYRRRRPQGMPQGPGMRPPYGPGMHRPPSGAWGQARPGYPGYGFTGHGYPGHGFPGPGYMGQGGARPDGPGRPQTQGRKPEGRPEQTDKGGKKKK